MAMVRADGRPVPLRSDDPIGRSGRLRETQRAIGAVAQAHEHPANGYTA